MTIKVLETVVLVEDIPEHNLKKGGLGAVVEIYEPDGIEVEFVMSAGKPRALITLKRKNLHSLSESNVLAVRSEYAA